MNKQVVNEFGFKRVSEENWLSIDPTWGAFGADIQNAFPCDPWVGEVLRYDLKPRVPLEVRELFEVARGMLAYGLLYYPLLTIGTEQLFRVYEAAATIKCQQLGAPASRTKTFDQKIKWLRDNGAILASSFATWDIIRQLRNHTSHPKRQNIFDPDMALNMLGEAIASIDGLFA
jgi:hypothetical protein